MPCSAKLPIIGLVAGAFFPHYSWVAPSAYFVSIISIILSAISLKKTKLFSGEATPFIMELPPYHFPQMKNVFLQMMQRGHSFVKKAGTTLDVSATLLPLLGYDAKMGLGRNLLSDEKSLVEEFFNKLNEERTWLK